MEAQPAENPMPSRSHWFPAWLRNHAGFMVILAGTVGLVVNIALLFQIGTPFGGYFSWVEPGDGWGLPSTYTPDWWPINAFYSDPARLWLKTADGQEYAYNVEAAFADAAAAGRPTVRIEANAPVDQPMTMDLPVLAFGLRDFIDIRLPDLIVGTAFFLLAIIVLRARPDHPLNRSFAVIASIVAAHRWLQAPVIFDGVGWYPVLLLTVATTLAAFTGPATLHFALLFPSPLRWIMDRVLPLMYVTAATLAITFALLRSPLSPVAGPEIAAITRALFPLVLILYLVGVFGLLARLTWSWFHERETRRQRRAAAAVLAGLVAALPMLLVMAAVVIPGLGGGTSSFWLGLDLRYSLLGVALAFAYVILRYQTFQSPSRLFIFVFALSFSALLAAIASWLWLLVPGNSAGPLTRPPFAILFGALLVANLFWSLASGGRGWFGRFMGWEQQSYDAARAFGERVMDTTDDLRELPAAISRSLVDEMALERAAVWLWHPDRGELALEAVAGSQTPAPPLTLDLPSSWIAGGGTRRVLPDETSPELAGLSAAGIELVVPLAAEREPLGLLGLGRRWDEEIFDDRDLSVAELVGQQASLFLLAGQRVDELRRVPSRLVAAQERERLRLARELHDTTQQFLGRLPFFLAVSRATIPSSPDLAAEMLDNCMDDIQDAAATLRSIRVDLAPNMLDTSLARPLEGLIGHVRQRAGLTIDFNAPDDLDDATTMETRHALYRVIQQALDNAVVHAGATQIDVELARSNGRVTFGVRDNGRGSTLEERHQAQSTGSFGLYSMQTRVESCGGEFAFISAPGQGTQVEGWVPARPSSGS
jgi:signal transduction histidine kinase